MPAVARCPVVDDDLDPTDVAGGLWPPELIAAVLADRWEQLTGAELDELNAEDGEIHLWDPVARVEIDRSGTGKGGIRALAAFTPPNGRPLLAVSCRDLAVLDLVASGSVAEDQRS